MHSAGIRVKPFNVYWVIVSQHIELPVPTVYTIVSHCGLNHFQHRFTWLFRISAFITIPALNLVIVVFVSGLV